VKGVVAKMKLKYFVWIVHLFAATAWSQQKPERLSSEHLLAQLDASFLKKTLAVSPDSRHVAYASKNGGKQYITVDMVKGKEYDSVSTPIFSPDSKRAAYAAMLGKKWCAVIDGMEEKQYDSIKASSIVFSPDSKRIAYAANLLNPNDKRNIEVDRTERASWFAVLDEKEPEIEYYGLGVYDLLFSPDSKHFVYWLDKAFLSGNSNEYTGGCVIMDGKREVVQDGENYHDIKFSYMYGYYTDKKVFDLKFTFSPKSNWYFYNTVDFYSTQKDHWYIVPTNKGRYGLEKYQVLNFVFSPDDERIAYIVKEPRYEYVHVHSKDQKHYIKICPEDPVFSSDGKYMAYRAMIDKNWCVVLNEKEGKEFKAREEKQYPNLGVGPRTLLFSPDSRHLSYMAINQNKWFVVFDEKEGKQYDGIGKETLIFSPDSKHLAYGAVINKKECVVIDGEEQKLYDRVDNVNFNLTSNHIIFGARTGSVWRVAIDGNEGKEYDGITTGSQIIIDPDDGFHYLASKGEKIYLVEEKLK
jgi:hypothetical protein